MRKYRFAIGPFSAVVLLSVVSFLDGPVSAIRSQQTPQKPPVFDLEQYQFGLLRKGPSWTAVTSPEGDRIQAGHLQNIGRMASLGRLVAAGPVLDNRDLRGIFIFKASSEEATQLASEDPAIKSGRLALSLLTWMGPKGVGADFIVQYQRDPAATRTTMTRYQLAFLRTVPGATSPDLQRVQLEHLWNVRRMMDDGRLSAAGPFTNGGDLRGVFVFATQSADEAREWGESDPLVKAGLGKIELHPWLVAREVWPKAK